MSNIMSLEPVDYFVIGHVAHDLTPDGPRLGGTVAYSALTARSLGLRMIESAVLYNLGNCHRVLAQVPLAWQCAEQAEACAAASEMREIEARSWLLRGHLRADAGEAGDGHACYERAALAFEACGLPHFASQAYAGRAALFLTAGDLSEARAWAERTAQAIAGVASLFGIDEPTWPSLVCHRVWLALGDARAPSALQRAHTDLLTMADRAGDAVLRNGILHDVPMHREVLLAWQAQAAATPPAGPR